RPAGSSSRAGAPHAEVSSQSPARAPLALAVSLVHGLLRDTEQGGDLLPAPAELTRLLHLQLLDRLEQRTQRCHGTQSDLRILTRCLHHHLNWLDHPRQDNLTGIDRQVILTTTGPTRSPHTCGRCSRTSPSARRGSDPRESLPAPRAISRQVRF